MNTRKRLLQKAISVLLCCITVVSACLIAVCAESEPEQEPEIGADYRYPKAEVMQLDIVMQPYHFLKMIHTPEKEEHDAAVSFNQGGFQNATIRLRGRSSLDAGFALSTMRLPLEIRLIDPDPETPFGDNPSVKLMNCLTPACFFTEYIAWQAYRFMGIPTPKILPVFIRINDEDFGLYLAAEEINQSFISQHFPAASALFKRVREGKHYASFQTVEQKAGTESAILDEVEAAVADRQPLDRFFDVDEALRFFACESFTWQSDGFLRAWNNYYVVEHESRLTILPWDLDKAFDAFTEAPELGESIYSFAENHNPIFSSITENPEYRERYLRYIRELNEVFLEPDTFLPWLDGFIRQIEPFMQRDPTIYRMMPDIHAELTSGNNLYNGFTGNLLLTFSTIRNQLNEQLRDRSSVYTIPEGCTTDADAAEAIRNVFLDAHRAERMHIAKICSGYWRMRRQFFCRAYGGTTAVICSIFILFLAAAVFSVCIPKGSRYGRKKREDVWNE